MMNVNPAIGFFLCFIFLVGFDYFGAWYLRMRNIAGIFSADDGDFNSTYRKTFRLRCFTNSLFSAYMAVTWWLAEDQWGIFLPLIGVAIGYMIFFFYFVHKAEFEAQKISSK
jgi:hypothetical protein